MTLSKMNRRNLMLAGMALAAGGSVAANWGRPGTTLLGAMQANAQEAADPAMELPPVQEMFLGNADAAVTVVEYGSFTCPHCAQFHADVFPQLKANYIDTGKIKFVYREVYFDKLGLWAGMLARCGGGSRYFGVSDLLFTNQAGWSHAATAPEAIDAMFALGRQAGLTDAEMDACIKDQANAEALVGQFQKNLEADGIDSTPTFILNGTKFSNMAYDEFAAELDKLLGA